MCHVATSGLDRATDLSVWEHARERGLAIVSKDSDFSDLAMLRGTPPKVIWLRIGNATTREAQAVLSGNQPQIETFLADPGLRVLVLR